MTVLGLDVSHWQDDNSTPQRIDFGKAYAAGARFVFIKASQATWRDDDMLYNWDKAKAAGLLRGAYHFLTWTTDPAKQAEFFWSTIKDDPGELPPVCDYEWWGTSIPANVLDILWRFLYRLEQLCGKNPIIYTSAGFWNPYGSKNAAWSKYPLWVAHYTTAAAPLIPQPWKGTETEPGPGYAFWQFSSHGDGLLYGAESKNIDLNYWPGTLEQLRAWCNLSTETPPDNESEEPIMAFSDFAMGKYVEDANWTNTAHPFIIALANKSWQQPNPNLKPIETKCSTLKVPMLVMHRFNYDYYDQQQYNPDDAHWPPLHLDEPYKQFTDAISARTFYGVVIEVNDRRVPGGTEDEDAYHLWFAADKFCGRVADWLRDNRKGQIIPIYLATSLGFIEYATGMNDLVMKYKSAVIKTVPTQSSFPAEGTKPGTFSRRTDWSLWNYSGSLWLYCGTKEKLYAELSFTPGSVVTPPPGGGTTTPPPAGEFVPLSVFNAYKAETEAKLTALQGEITTIKAKAITGTTEERNW